MTDTIIKGDDVKLAAELRTLMSAVADIAYKLHVKGWDVSVGLNNAYHERKQATLIYPFTTIERKVRL